MKYENLNKEKSIFLGLEILRMFFSFTILFLHCMNRRIYSHTFLNNLNEVVSVALTTFFIMAFYFSYNSFISKNIDKIKGRFKRLLIPYILWPIIIYLQKEIYNYKHRKKEKLFRILIYQIIIGNGLNMLLWFNLNLIFVLLFFAIAIFINNKYMTYIILIGIQIISFSFSDNYHKFWDRYNRIVHFPLRPISNTYKLGLAGFFLSSIKIIEKTKITKKIILVFILGFLSQFLFNNSSLKGTLRIIFTTFLIVIFASIPFEKINIIIFKFIKQITSYTGGLYYIHAYINSLLNNYTWSNIISKNIYKCIKHYFLCYFICFIGSQLFKKISLKYLFN